MNDGRLYIVLSKADKGMSYVGIVTGLIITVKCVDILDELSVEEVKRNMLGTYSGAFAAVGTSSGNVERADDVEHIFLKAVVSCFLSNAGVGVIEYTLLAGAGRAYVAARIAADAAGKLASPELKSLICGHVFKLFYQVKSAAVSDLFAVFADYLIVYSKLFGFAISGPKSVMAPTPIKIKQG